MSYSTCAVCAALALAPVGAVASAPIESGLYRAIVVVGDIDPTTREGAAALARKVWMAAQETCSRSLRGDQFAAVLQRSCIRRSVAAAQPQLDRVIAMKQRARPAWTEVAVEPKP